MKNRLTNEEITKVLLKSYPKSKVISISRVQERTRKRIVVEYICGQCNSRNVSAYDNIKKQKGCKICGLRKRKPIYTPEIVDKELTLRGFEWINREEYNDANSIIKTKCRKCGKLSSANVTNRLKNNRGCAQCLGLSKKSINEVHREFMELDKEYIILSENYVSAHSPLKVKHTKCGKVFNITRANFRGGKRCPSCINYKGEKKIREVLTNMGVNFIQQYSFNDCVYKKPLKFDFAVFIKDNVILIEYNGKQHYKPVEHFGGEESFKVQVIKDNIKREYCLSKGIRLIEIDYKSFANIESILERELVK